ncbi:MAG: heme exporter protein CcmD [Alphaproteobacteria bacterium]|jgi:heme exporter protein D|nr:heme exporter protein CcmD [Alphaproteobacteria bacterium]
MSEFLHMGGYALYVWLSYGVVVCSLIVLAIMSWRQYKKVQKQLILLEESTRS